MITTKTDISNLALGKLAARRIASYDSDSTVEARACRLHLDHVVDTLLQRHQWNFGTARIGLSKLVDEPLSEWAAAWQLPADCVRILRLSTDDPLNPIPSFAREGRKILCNETVEVNLVYVTNLTPVNEWDPLFVDAVVFKLAAEIAGDVTQNPALADDCLKKLEALALPAAQTADARETNSGENFGALQLISQSQLVRTRLGGGSPAHLAGRTIELP